MKYYQKIKKGEFGIDVLYTKDDSEDLYIIRDVREKSVRQLLGPDYDYLYSRNITKYGFEYCVKMNDSHYRILKDECQ